MQTKITQTPDNTGSISLPNIYKGTLTLTDGQTVDLVTGFDLLYKVNDINYVLNIYFNNLQANLNCNIKYSPNSLPVSYFVDVDVPVSMFNNTVTPVQGQPFNVNIIKDNERWFIQDNGLGGNKVYTVNVKYDYVDFLGEQHFIDVTETNKFAPSFSVGDIAIDLSTGFILNPTTPTNQDSIFYDINNLELTFTLTGTHTFSQGLENE